MQWEVLRSFLPRENCSSSNRNIELIGICTAEGSYIAPQAPIRTSFISQEGLFLARYGHFAKQNWEPPHGIAVSSFLRKGYACLLSQILNWADLIPWLIFCDTFLLQSLHIALWICRWLIPNSLILMELCSGDKICELLLISPKIG